MKSKIFGRNQEISILESIWSSKEAELVALYGRRRVGKTYLVRECFSHKEFYCEIVGKKGGSLQVQLENFSEAFSKTFCNNIPIEKPKNWKKAFDLLTGEIEKLPKSKKIVLFIDELPWLATPKSGLLQNIDYFWNSKWSRFGNLKIILCGSAAAWMLDNLINAKGGLYNRITRSILLEPFNLFETKVFLKNQGVILNDKQVLDIYMAIGGVAHYLKQIEKGKSAVQNINDICFNKKGLLFNEFPKIFKSLFDSSEIHLAMVKAIASHQYGIDRKELLSRVGLESGGTFNKRIEELEAAGFIQSFYPYGKKTKDQYYRIIDEYTLFYLTWIDKRKNSIGIKDNYWTNRTKTGVWLNWAGYAFEQICYKHVEQIKKALALDKVPCEVGNWRYIPGKGSKEKGAQIDLLFDRDDGVITICEIKYSENEFTIDKSYADSLVNKINVFEKHFSSKKQIFLSMITTIGVKKNMWQQGLIHNQVLLKHLIAD